MLSWLFNYPTDVIKTRFQTNDQDKSYMDVIRKTYAERGIKTFFVGFGTTLLRLVFLGLSKHMLNLERFQPMRRLSLREYHTDSVLIMIYYVELNGLIEFY